MTNKHALISVLRSTSFLAIFSLVAFFAISIVLVNMTSADDTPSPVTTAANVSGNINTWHSVSDLKVNKSGSIAVGLVSSDSNAIMRFGTSAGLTFANGTTEGSNLQITGNVSNINTALATLQVKSPTDKGNATITVTATDPGYSVLPQNGHSYLVVVKEEPIDWTDAKNEAAAQTYKGLPGYLATITSSEEHEFIKARISTDGWIGASDAAVEGEWRWVTGPEAAVDGGKGLQFWQGNGATGHLISGQYAKWNGAEPNDSGDEPGEDYAQMRFNQTSDGEWNDLQDSSNVEAYIVEFGSTTNGGGPEIDKSTFTFKSYDPTKEASRNNPNGGDGNNDGIPDENQPNVAPVTGPTSNTPQVIDLDDENCEINFANNNSDTLPTATDAGYTYPLGMTDFKATCDAPGKNLTITIRYYNTDLPLSQLVARKFINNVYKDVPGATITEEEIDGQRVITLAYSVTEGDVDSDDDGVADSVLLDPVGLALKPTAPNTGLNSANAALQTIALIIGVATLAVAYRVRVSSNK